MGLPAVLRPFEPTDAMLRYAAEYVRHLERATLRARRNPGRPATVSYRAVAKRLGLPEDIHVHWRRMDPMAFEGWFSSVVVDLYKGPGKREVWAALREKAVSGDTTAMKLYLERFDEEFKPTTRHELQVPQVDPESERIRRAVRENPDLLRLIDESLEG